jgi:hypothetical protein
MYAGVPTVDLGFECSSDDCRKKKTVTVYLFVVEKAVAWHRTCLGQQWQAKLLLEVRKWKAIAFLEVAEK